MTSAMKKMEEDKWYLELYVGEHCSFTEDEIWPKTWKR